ncbi:MAG: methyl-accepting chemotaxis protein [Deltaproteobacteria bacterium]|nr:methyl-accepting chemotaxis protein [Deltaproteobacteria bacterium]
MPVGHKFIFGFLAVVAAAAFVPGVIENTAVPEWLQSPMSFLVAMVIGLVLGEVFTRAFTKDFSRLTRLTQRISRGELTHVDSPAPPGKFFPDEINDLEEALLLVFTNLRGLVVHLRDTVKNLTEAQATLTDIVAKGHKTSGEVITGTGKIFAGALEQTRHMENTSLMVKEVSQMADAAASKVRDTAAASEKVNTMVHRGVANATSAIEKMEAIFTGTDRTEQAATRLKEKLGEVPKILDVITHISRQTDLIAINATIEASKAGEHGRGFALVAEEVRRFADNTAKSVEDVSIIVRELKTEVAGVVETAHHGVASVKEGRDDIRKIRDILSTISDYTSEVARQAGVILELTEKQKGKAEKAVSISEEVANIARENLSSTEKVDNAVEKHSAAMEEAVSASKKLSKLSGELKNVVSKFTLDP